MSVIYRGVRALGSRSPVCAARSLLCATLLGVSLPALSADSATFTLSEALARAIADSPALAGYPYELRAAEARALQAGLRPNPELELEIENLAGTGDQAGLDGAEATLALSQVIEMGNKRQYRERVARINSQVLERDYELARLDVLAEAATRFLAVAQARHRLEFAEQMAKWTAEAVDVANARYKAGSASRAELSQARIEATQARLQVARTENHLETARLQLAALWGSSEAAFPPVAAELYELAEIPAFDQVRARLEASPELQRFVTLERLRQAEVSLAQARGRQDIELGLGVKRLQATDEQALVLGFSMPLGINDRNQGNVAAARADLERLAIERSAAQVRLFAELFGLYQQLEQARLTAATLREAALPEAKQALNELQEGYRSGRYSYLQLVEVRRQLLAVTFDAIAAATEFHQTLVALETLTGEPLTETRPHQLPSAAAYRPRPGAGIPEFSEPNDHGSTAEQDKQ
jgi:cobalt-zinc-cadmium efflux system outer membrane protein